MATQGELRLREMIRNSNLMLDALAPVIPRLEAISPESYSVQLLLKVALDCVKGSVDDAKFIIEQAQKALDEAQKPQT